MTTTTLHPLAADYLDRLEHDARGLPRDERRELVQEISAHLSEATNPDMSDAEVLTVLDRLGDPERIVEAGQAEQADEPVRHRGTHEWAAIFLLLFGGFIFVFGWVAGVILLWSSRAWDTRDKLIGTLVVPGGLATVVAAAFLGATARVCSSGPGHPTTCTPGPTTLHQIAAIAVLCFCFFGPIFTSIYLARRAR